MIIAQLKNLNSIQHQNNNMSVFGCNQNWYATAWKRQAGCGPTVAATIHGYLLLNRNLKENEGFFDQSKQLKLMNIMWSYITPSLSGVATTSRFIRHFKQFTLSKAIDSTFSSCDIVKQPSKRVALKQVIDFIMSALINDSPVAFLNLNHGNQKSIDSWHWTIIVKLTQEQDQSYIIDVLDNGDVKEINLSQWYQTTSMGGGFVVVDYVDKQPLGE